MDKYEKKQIKEYLSCRRLSLEEEKVLLDRALVHNDKDARDEIVNSHLYLVAFIALKQTYSPLSVGDLMEEGILGLWDALRKFNIASGNRFATFASHDVKGRIKRAIRGEWRSRPPGFSIDASLSDEEGSDRGEMMVNMHQISADFQLHIQETEEEIGSSLSILGEFLQGFIVNPFHRREISQGILKASRTPHMNAVAQEIGGSLFSGSDPFERCTLFNRLLSL